MTFVNRSGGLVARACVGVGFGHRTQQYGETRFRNTGGRVKLEA
jgi:hypothetical protein